VGTLASELGAALDRTPGPPRVYADANVPAGLVALMRRELRWDVFFVLEQDDLRRNSDLQHFRLARQMRRTLVSLDRDYLDDRLFPSAETAGVVVVSAPDEWQLARVLRRVDPLLRTATPPQTTAAPAPGAAPGAPAAPGPGAAPAGPLPLEGRKLHVHPDWRLAEPLVPRRRRRRRPHP
jgi:hypothetical protein